MRTRFVSFMLALIVSVSLLTGSASAANVSSKSSVVDGGMSHSVALSKDGEVYVWGDNSSGQLGLGAEVTHEDFPTKLTSLSSIVAVAAGYNFTMALRFNGRVLVWGNGLYQTPTEITGLENITAISAGQMNCLALASDGRVYQWTPGTAPKLVNGIKNVVAISAGGSHCLALTRTGEVWSWGFNESGQLGDGTTNERTTPKKIDALLDIVSIAAGTNHSLAADFNGNVYAWGDNTYGQMGSQPSSAPVKQPVRVKGLQKIVQVAAGNGSSLALDSGGRVYSWGYGEYGQNGNSNTDIAKAIPSQISRTDTAVYIACGVYHDLLITQNGTLYAWGRNNYGQLGTKQNSNAKTATKIRSGFNSDLTYNTCVLDGISKWAQDEIFALYPRNMVPPSLLGNYQETVTRAQLAHLLVTVYEIQKGTTVNANGNTKFKDISGHPMQDSIVKAYSLGIINGTSDTTFSPEGKVTRQEAVTMICRFVGKLNNVKIPTSTTGLSYYSDANQVAEWAAPYVAYAYDKNIMKGSSGQFFPKDPFTVEQSLLTVSRILPEDTGSQRRS